jgi:archaellum component FlaC
MANKVKGFLHRIGRFLAAPFMGYVWMARCKDLLTDNERLVKSNGELISQVANLQGSLDTQNKELGARMKRILYFANELEKRKSQYNALSMQAEQAKKDLDALHGYALDLDAQCSDLDAKFHDFHSKMLDCSVHELQAVANAIHTLQTVPSARRMNKRDLDDVVMAIRAITFYTLPEYESDSTEPTKTAEPVVQV